MSVTSGFFNSLDGDRKYSAEQFSAIYDGVINDGVFASVGNAFMVTAGTGVTINVDTGRAWFNSAWIYNDAILPITAEASELLLDRYDAVVIEIDHSLSVRNGSIKIVKGTPASSPSYPTMLSSEDVHQYPLAYIYRTAGSTSITQGNITNAVGTSACPYVTGILQVQDIDNIVAQWQAQWLEWKANWDSWNSEWDIWFEDEKNRVDTEAYQWMLDSRANFTAWFNELSAILDGDTATALTAQVLELQQRFSTLAKDRCVIEDLLDSSGSNIDDNTGSDLHGSTVFPAETGTTVVFPDNPDNPGSSGVGNEVITLSHSKTGTVHTLSMSVSPASMLLPLIPIQFKATAAYSDGDTFTIDGTPCTAKLQNGEELDDEFFVSGGVVSAVLEVEDDSMILNFNRAGGGAKLPAETTAIVAIFTANDTWTVPRDGKYRITVIGAGGSGRAAVDRGYSSGGYYAGGGGGAGGAAQSELELSKNESYAITVSTSKSSFGSLLTATVGAAPSSSSSSSYLGGSGGTASGGNLWNEKGGDGGDGEHGTTSMDYSGGDGGSYTRTNKFIGPTSGAAGNSVDCGQAPSVPTSGGFFPYGGGCSGGASEDPSGTNEDYLHNGGTGSKGAVIIEFVLE